MENRFLPLSRDDMKMRRWDELDVILITGDAYVDHPSYGVAVIGRVLEQAGYRVGIIPQPDWKSTGDFLKLGKPRLFVGITAGNLDSMVSNYSAGKRPRLKDAYSPGGRPGFRPDRATIVYANRVREVFRDITIVLGGIEASLRRFAHYDWWGNDVRRSILLDARGDILVYGMGEKQVLEIADRLRRKVELAGIRGTLIAMKDPSGLNNAVTTPSLAEVSSNADAFNEAFTIISRNQDPHNGNTVIQWHDNRAVVQFPPPRPPDSSELDRIYELPYIRSWHRFYDKDGGVPGLETVRFSIVSHRGCPGECSFCGLSLHQGRIVQSRSTASLIREATVLTKNEKFRGTITDVGGPTANLYGASCRRWQTTGACRDKGCIMPEKCKNLHIDYHRSIETLKKIRALPGVNHVFLESGLRFDLLTEPGARKYLENLCAHHISGQLKVAPEHSVSTVLSFMNKPLFPAYEKFTELYRDVNRQAGKKQYLVNYFISAHPGTTLNDTLSLALYLIRNNIHPEQIQDFIPLPMTRSGAMYHTRKDPVTGKAVYVPKTFRERKMHRALMQYRNETNRKLVEEALRLLKKESMMHIFFPAQRRKKGIHGTTRNHG